MGSSRKTMDLLWRIEYFFGMDMWKTYLWWMRVWVRGLLNQEPYNQDRTLSNPTYLKINQKLNTINIHISHYLGSTSTIPPLIRIYPPGCLADVPLGQQ